MSHRLPSRSLVFFADARSQQVVVCYTGSAMAGDHDAGSGCNDSVAGGRPAGLPLGVSLANI